jgi:hypothetical protein
MASFHLLSYLTNNSGGSALTVGDMPAVVDTVFSTQAGSGGNQHFIFTDNLVLLGAAVMGATITFGQIYSPTLVSYGNFCFPEINAAATPGSFPRMLDLRARPFSIPMTEQIQMEITTTSAENDSGHMWVAPMTWAPNQVQGTQRVLIQMTASYTGIAFKWSGLQTLTFTQQPKGGWYCVNGAWCVETTSRAWRMFFPRAPGIASGRQLRPGDLVQHAVGNLWRPGWNQGLGAWGAFHTFEPPLIETIADTANSAAPTLYLDCDYLGQADPQGAYPIAV